jgi:hypothetical protein
MNKITPIAITIVGLLGGCSQPQGTATPMAASTGGMDPNSVTVFTLAVQPDSVSGCIMGDASMTRPMTLTVKNNAAVLLTSGGIHYDLSRIAPNVYAGGYYIKIKADLSVAPKRLTVTNDDQSCKWAATTP